jgi:hypothetical protein
MQFSDCKLAPDVCENIADTPLVIQFLLAVTLNGKGSRLTPTALERMIPN